MNEIQSKTKHGLGSLCMMKVLTIKLKMWTTLNTEHWIQWHEKVLPGFYKFSVLQTFNFAQLPPSFNLFKNQIIKTHLKQHNEGVNHVDHRMLNTTAVLWQRGPCSLWLLGTKDLQFGAVADVVDDALDVGVAEGGQEVLICLTTMLQPLHQHQLPANVVVAHHQHPNAGQHWRGHGIHRLHLR